MERNKVVFVCHCILNIASKVTYYGEKYVTEEELNRREFIKLALEKNICIVQLPCPEFNIYGANRWGHTKDQFNNPFFKDNSRRMLEPYMLQIEEYLEVNDKFQVLGIVGIDGSPSCGVNFTCGGKWDGEMSSRVDLKEVIGSARKVAEKGVFMELMDKMLADKDIELPMMSIREANEIIRKLD